MISFDSFTTGSFVFIGVLRSVSLRSVARNAPRLTILKTCTVERLLYDVCTIILFFSFFYFFERKKNNNFHYLARWQCSWEFSEQEKRVCR